MLRLEKETNLLKSRSDRMLGLGVFFGGLGVCFSIVMFKMSDMNLGSWTEPRTILSILRPIILLIFVEIFTFFFLKQYRIIFNEYKLFYSVYLKLLNYFHLLELNKDEATQKDLITAINAALLTEKYDLYETGIKTQVNEFDSSTAMQKLFESLRKP